MGRPIRYRVKFTLGDREYEVEPTFAYIDHVEQHIRSQYEIGQDLIDGRYRMSDLTHVVHSALVSSGYTDLSYTDVGQAIMDEMTIGDAAIIAGKIIMASQNINPDQMTVKLSDGEEVPAEEAAGKEHAGQTLEPTAHDGD